MCELKIVRRFVARNASNGLTAKATIYERADGSLVAYEDADRNFDSPLGEATADEGAERLENSLT
jgi:hypothetical protein